MDHNFATSSFFSSCIHKSYLQKFCFFFGIGLFFLVSIFSFSVSKEMELVGIVNCKNEFCEFVTTIDVSYISRLQNISELRFDQTEKIKELRFSNPRLLNPNQIVEDVTFVLSSTRFKDQELLKGKIALGSETIARKIWNIWKGGEDE